MRCSLIIILFVTICGVVQSSPIDTLRLSNEEYRKKVLDYSLELKQINEKLFQAEQELRNIKSGMLPQLSGELNFNYIMDNLDFKVDNYVFELSHYNYGVAVTIAQNIYSGGAIRIGSRVAEKGVNMAMQARLLTIDNVVYGADYAYWSLVAVGEYYRMSWRYLNIVKGAAELVRERYESGLISKNDLLLIDTRLAEAELNYTNLRGKLISAKIAFNVMSGASNQVPVTSKDRIYVNNPTLPKMMSLEEVLSLRPDYLMAIYQVSISRKLLLE